jgi:hypothetical protein
MQVIGHLHDPAASPPGKEPLVPIGQEAQLKILLENLKGRDNTENLDVDGKTLLKFILGIQNAKL